MSVLIVYQHMCVVCSFFFVHNAPISKWSVMRKRTSLHMCLFINGGEAHVLFSCHTLKKKGTRVSGQRHTLSTQGTSSNFFLIIFNKNFVDFILYLDYQFINHICIIHLKYKLLQSSYGTNQTRSTRRWYRGIPLWRHRRGSTVCGQTRVAHSDRLNANMDLIPHRQPFLYISWQHRCKISRNVKEKHTGKLTIF